MSLTIKIGFVPDWFCWSETFILLLFKTPLTCCVGGLMCLSMKIGGKVELAEQAALWGLLRKHS